MVCKWQATFLTEIFGGMRNLSYIWTIKLDNQNIYNKKKNFNLW